ncbi:MAG: hypothetical protein ACN6PX_03035 [Stenotrophomonas lactitubi]|uniref:hypothetical protein n=1 Tax=Stenotrophomonas lactitubi TaxID=2045214 RepID=UPI003D0DFB48
MSDNAQDTSKMKLGDLPIKCTFHFGNHDEKPGVFHRFVESVDTDEGNNKFAVTYALVEDSSGRLYQIEPLFLKILR